MDNSLDKRTILIVDDMPINIQVLAGSLKSEYQIKIATSGGTALKIARSEQPPDLILLDIMMPEMDGYEVLRQLKERASTQNIPVIFVSAKGEVEDETRGLGMGAVDYITKPFHQPIVQARVKTQMNLIQKTEILEQLVSLDGLTSIPNRRRFDDVFEKEWRRARRVSHPLSLIMIDIDYFKAFNDKYGHAVGDDCLKFVAMRLTTLVNRGGDLVARYGGEEFAVVLPETNADNANLMSERFRESIESLKIPHLTSPVADHVTLSAGSATIIPTSNENHLTLIRAADKMLYEAKSAGRNQCKFIDLSDDAETRDGDESVELHGRANADPS
ncbi:MAG: diguanylate cyclase [Desulfatitalea sp.]|nr:diguanylate cyclase [Desulfatitalea sp.]NNK00625.1 diguanylate cyclase [Desulfatitalea sp.]